MIIQGYKHVGTMTLRGANDVFVMVETDMGCAVPYYRLFWEGGVSLEVVTDYSLDKFCDATVPLHRPKFNVTAWVHDMDDVLGTQKPLWMDNYDMSVCRTVHWPSEYDAAMTPTAARWMEQNVAYGAVNRNIAKEIWKLHFVNERGILEQVRRAYIQSSVA